MPRRIKQNTRLLTEFEKQLEIEVASQLGSFRKRNNETLDETMLRINAELTLYSWVAEEYKDAIITKHRHGLYRGSKLWKRLAKGTYAYDEYLFDEITQVIIVITILIVFAGLFFKITGGM